MLEARGTFKMTIPHLMDTSQFIEVKLVIVFIWNQTYRAWLAGIAENKQQDIHDDDFIFLRQMRNVHQIPSTLLEFLSFFRSHRTHHIADRWWNYQMQNPILSLSAWWGTRLMRDWIISRDHNHISTTTIHSSSTTPTTTTTTTPIYDNQHNNDNIRHSSLFHRSIV